VTIISRTSLDWPVRQRADAKGCLDLSKTEAGQRTIPLPRRVVALLTEWKLACPPQSEELVFPGVTGKALSHPVMMKRHAGPIQLVAGLMQSKDPANPRYTLHPFRHATASMWIEHGLTPERVQYLMGHSSIHMDVADADAIERALYERPELINRMYGKRRAMIPVERPRFGRKSKK